MSPIYKKKGVWIALVFGLLCVVSFALTFLGSRDPGQVAPSSPESGVLAEGDTIPYDIGLMGTPGTLGTQLSTYKGKVILLNFWAGWCGPCLKEMPSLYKLHEKLHAKGLEVLGMNMDEVAADGFATLEKVAGKAPFPQYSAFEQPILSKFAVEGLPLTIIIDRKGKIVYAKPGERDWAEAEALAAIEELL